jgi:lipopolysaccharide biosynthesis protein
LGLCKDNDNSYVINDFHDLKCQIKISYHENYGADIAPFLSQLHDIKEPLFIKLHSKKSFYGTRNQVNWRAVLVHDLIGNNDIVKSNILSFEDDTVGMVCNQQLLYSNLEGSNSDNIKEICSLLNIDYNIVKNGSFIGGSMFMSRTDLFQESFSKYQKDKILNLLKHEIQKIDDTNRGTYTHAMERLFGYIIEYNKLTFNYPKHNFTIINNSRAVDGKLHLIELYNQDCYLLEDINAYGKVLNNTINNQTIEWYHINKPIKQIYVKNNVDNTLTQEPVQNIANYLLNNKSTINNPQIDYSKIYNNQSPKKDITTLAFYLPQFHQIPENNMFWGEGFTEWTNVSKGKPRFIGHRQPKIPSSEFGFYDLEYDNQIFIKQIDLADRIGIDGFVFYYYRFGSKEIMKKPLIKILKNKKLDLKYAFCWANENWTKNWDGLNKEILIEQKYETNDISIIQDLLPFFQDSRYIKINNKPLFIIYKANQIPNIITKINRWNEILSLYGFDGIEILVVNNIDLVDNKNISGNISFSPTNLDISHVKHSGNYIYDYKELIAENKKQNQEYNNYLCLIPSWDNSARRKKDATIFVNDTQHLYCDWLIDSYIKTNLTQHKLLFINAWNEWAEGAYLEPDLELGFNKANCHTVVNLLRSEHIDQKSSKIVSFASKPINNKIAYIIHGYYFDILEDILNFISNTKQPYDLYVSLPRDTPTKVYASILCTNPYANILHVDNIGRDILPWLQFNSLIDFNQYEAVCKLHTKKTLWNKKSGDYVRNINFQELISSSSVIDKNIQKLQNNTQLGIIGAKTLKFSLNDWIGSNYNNLKNIYNKDIDIKKHFFIAGTMFWYKPQSINNILDLKIDNNIFEREPIERDGHVPHAIERLFGIICADNNYSIEET